MLKNCCLCLSVRSGSFAIGLFSIVLTSVILKIQTTPTTMNVRFFDNNFSCDNKNFVETIASLVMTLILSAMLIVGSIYKLRYFVLPYVCLSFMLIISIISSVIGYVTNSLATNDSDLTNVLLLLTGFFLFNIYSCLVVYSFYEMLSQQNYEHVVKKRIDDMKVENI